MIAKKTTVVGSLLAAVVWCAGCRTEQPLTTVAQVELERYEGTWYEIARLPQFFEKDCACVTANYAQQDEYIRVRNTCLDTTDQAMRTSEGKAFPVEGSSNSKLKVQFFFPFKGDYYIIDLSEDYQWALVGSPSRSSLWILARNPSLTDSTTTTLLRQAEAKGFDTTEIIFTDQSRSCNHKNTTHETQRTRSR